MVNRFNVALQTASDWDHGLVTFNVTKTQACLFSAKFSRIRLAPTFRGVYRLTNSLQLLGVDLSSNYNCGQYMESKAQITAKKLGILSKVRR